jgi:hypothetical protein
LYYYIWAALLRAALFYRHIFFYTKNKEDRLITLEEKRLKSKKWREDNKEKIKAYNLANREKNIAYKKKYCQAKAKPKPKKNNYFHEQEMYQLWKIYPNHTPTQQLVFWNQISQVIKGVIFTAKLQRFESVDDCFSMGMEAVLTALPKFDPTFISSKTNKPATLFNYISLTAKRAIIYGTIRQKRHRDVESYEHHLDNGWDKAHYFDSPALNRQEFKSIAKKAIDKSRPTLERRREYYHLVELTCSYLDTFDIPSKSKLIHHFRVHTSYPPNRFRSYFQILSKCQQELYSAIQEG